MAKSASAVVARGYYGEVGLNTACPVKFRRTAKRISLGYGTDDFLGSNEKDQGLCFKQSSKHKKALIPMGLRLDSVP